MTIRERLEQEEAQRLSPRAVCAKDTRGREKPIVPCPMRTDFQRDRDRIIHCKAFRRLKYKTQVFLAPEGDHYRTRLTHTLEVAQIARTLARCLQLNEDLTEAIALGHDLGHTPFGHIGEHALDRLMPEGFPAQRAVEALRRGAGERRKRAEPDVGGARRHPLSLRQAVSRNAGGAVRPPCRPNRVSESRFGRRPARRGLAAL